MATIPAGKYWIMDPCYVLSDEKYDSIVSNMTMDKKNFMDNYPYIYDENGRRMVILPTKYGDGDYMSSEGGRISVDSGQIAIIPEGIMDREKLDGSREYGIEVEVREGEVYYDRDGSLYFSDVVVYTGEYEEEEDEEDEDW